MPTTEVGADALVDDAVGIIDMLVMSKLAPSKGEARRLIQQGGIAVDDEKVTDFAYAVTKEKLENGVVVKKGKKVFHRFILA